ncbi:MAG: hypothetical protein MUC35_05600 [Candidatus Margulisbacteria bacterium]|nr:hypothetical protein [Candidatus Margulisiibacteriota bacterium]
MEENLSWKSIFWGVFFSLFILALTYLLISPRENTFFTRDKSDKLAEFRETRVVGRQDGRTVWEMVAAGGWSDKAQEITHLSGISKGKILNREGRTVLANLTAPNGRAWRHSEVVEADGGVTAVLDLGKFSRVPKQEREWTSLRGDSIKYFPTEKRSEVRGRIRLQKKESVIRADELNIDQEKKTAVFNGGINLTRRDSDLRAASLEYWGETEALAARGEIDLRLKESRTRTAIRCDRADLFVDLNKDIALQGSLEVVQGKKRSRAESGLYSRAQQKLRLRGRTVTVLENKTVIRAEEMLYSLRNGDAWASGNVEATQKERQARSDSAFYDDRNETVTLQGNVTLKRGTEWLRCRQVTISVKKETFEARGVADSSFNL